MPDAEISARLGIPVGSIGPNRSRALDRLRRDQAIVRLINGEAGGAQMSAMLYGNLRAEIVDRAGIRLQRISLRHATTDLLLPRQPEAPRKPDAGSDP